MQQNIMNGLKGATGVMANINQDMNVQEISQVMREFNKEMGKAEIQNEMVADAMDMAEGLIETLRTDGASSSPASST